MWRVANALTRSPYDQGFDVGSLAVPVVDLAPTALETPMQNLPSYFFQAFLRPIGTPSGCPSAPLAIISSMHEMRFDPTSYQSSNSS